MPCISRYYSNTATTAVRAAMECFCHPFSYESERGYLLPRCATVARGWRDAAESEVRRDPCPEGSPIKTLMGWDGKKFKQTRTSRKGGSQDGAL